MRVSLERRNASPTPVRQGRGFLGFLLGAALAGLLAVVPGTAQDPGDLAGFLAAGKAAYEKGDLSGAAIEFENVLLLDPRHLDAKAWLIQIAIGRGQRAAARARLAELRRRAPEHARIEALTDLLGENEGPPAVPDANDTARADKRRPYGLVIPEARVITRRTLGLGEDEIDLALLDDVPFPDALPPGTLAQMIADEGPLGPVFELWAAEGLAPALEKYYQLVLDRRDLMAIDDRGLLREGLEAYQSKFAADPQDIDARFHLGMISYLNGLIEDALQVLEPLRQEQTRYRERLAPIFADLDRRKSEEEARRAALQKQKEAEEAARLAEKERQEALAMAAKSTPTASAASEPGPLNPADVLHQKGYALYKRGALDQAIEKFEAAIAKNNKEPRYHYHMGLALTDKGLAGSTESFNRAVKAFNRVISLDPGSKMAKDSEVMIRDIVAAKRSLGN